LESRLSKKPDHENVVILAFSGGGTRAAAFSKLWSRSWGRSEMAATIYDEILFKGATFADLNRGSGPFINVSATDITNGSRMSFNQGLFDILCSDLGAVSLSRAAAASSAVPVVLSPVTLNNYGGTCNYTAPEWIKPFFKANDAPRPAARAIREVTALADYRDSVRRPYIHLVDGGVSDNLGMRGVLDALEVLETLHDLGAPTPLDRARRIIILIVNSLSTPPTDWDKHERAPGTLKVLVKATDAALRTPDPELYAIDVSFQQLKDKNEVKYLNKLPTCFISRAKRSIGCAPLQARLSWSLRNSSACAVMSAQPLCPVPRPNCRNDLFGARRVQLAFQLFGPALEHGIGRRSIGYGRGPLHGRGSGSSLIIDHS
jgi:Patatin-like phospholipase